MAAPASWFPMALASSGEMLHNFGDHTPDHISDNMFHLQTKGHTPEHFKRSIHNEYKPGARSIFAKENFNPFITNRSTPLKVQSKSVFENLISRHAPSETTRISYGSDVWNANARAQHEGFTPRTYNHPEHIITRASRHDRLADSSITHPVEQYTNLGR